MVGPPLTAISRSFLTFLALGSAGCLIRPKETGAIQAIQGEQKASFEALAEEMRRVLLDRHTVPAPTLSFAPQTREEEGVRVTVAPALAEAMPWNAWPDGTARLFNDSVGFLWTVTIEAPAPVQWSPAHTSLAVNDTEQVFSVAAAADDVLQPLLQGAALEAALGARADFSLRARAADEFRRAYFPVRSAAGQQKGVLVFPAPVRSIHAVAMQLDLGLVVQGVGVRRFRFLFE